MNNIFSQSERSKTGNLDANLILRQHELDLMARFMEIKSTTPKLTQNEIAKELGYSNSSLLRYRHTYIHIRKDRSLQIQSPRTLKDGN